MRLLHEEVEYDIKESILPEELKTDPRWIRRWFGVNRIVPTLSRLLGTYAGRPTLVQTTSGGALSVSGAVSPYGGVRVYYVTQDMTASLPPNGAESVWVVPAKGYVMRMIGVYAYMTRPTGATTGGHKWGVCMMGMSAFGMWGEGSYGASLVVQNYQGYSGFSTFVPSMTWSALAFPLLGTYEYPLQSYYINGTDVANTNLRRYTIAIAEYPAIMP